MTLTTNTALSVEPKTGANQFKYGVFQWHADPCYHVSEAIRLYHSKAAAEKYARANDLVVRDLAYCYAA